MAPLTWIVDHDLSGLRIDPYLQWLILQAGHWETAGDGPRVDPDEEVSVLGILPGPLARIDDALRKVIRFGDMFSAVVRIGALKQVLNRSGDLKIKAARTLWLLLTESVNDAHCASSDLSGSGLGNLKGSGVVIGVIDNGLDLAHKNFRDVNDKTRVLALWDQGSPGGPAPSGYLYGREFLSAEIDQLLAAGTIDHEYTVADSAHGTFVTDIAAGNGRGTQQPGVAPESPIIFVEIKNDMKPEENLGDSRSLFNAVSYILDRANDLMPGAPVVINISLGMNAGPHDGTTPLDRLFEQQLSTVERSIVIAAGNSECDRIHASGTATAALSVDLMWNIRDPNTTGELEVWYPGRNELSVTLVSPTGDVVGPFGPTITAQLMLGLAMVGAVIQTRNDPYNGDNLIDIFIAPSAGLGKWTVRLATLDGQDVPFDGWIERNGNLLQSCFIKDDPSKTLNSIACQKDVIAVGAYTVITPGGSRSICRFSASGPTRSGYAAPLLVAPGGGGFVTAARARSASALRDAAGTSSSAPHVAGAVALIYEATKGIRPLTASEVQKALSGTAVPVNGATPQVSGHGALDGVAAIKAAVAIARRPAP